MKLTELAIKPKLSKISIENPELVEKYGETIDFYVLDRLPLEKYTRLASLKTEDLGSMMDLVKELILDENGNQVMDEDHVLPTDILNEAMIKVVEVVGK